MYSTDKRTSKAVSYSDFKKAAAAWGEPTINMTMGADGVFKPNGIVGGNIIPKPAGGLGPTIPKAPTGTAAIRAAGVAAGAKGMPWIPAFGPDEVFAKDPVSGEYIPYGEYKQTIRDNPQLAYQPGMTAQEKYDAFQDRMRNAVRDEQGGFWGSVATHAKDFFGGGDWKNFWRPSAWTKEYTYSSTPGTASYDARQKALSSDRAGKEVDAFADSLSLQDKLDLQKANPSAMSATGNPAMDNLKSRGLERIKATSISQIWEDPIKNLPIAASLFLRQYGMDNLADFAENPWAFYGSLAAVLFGGAALLSDGASSAASGIGGLLGGGNSNQQPIIINNGGAGSVDPRMNRVPYRMT